MYGSYVMKHCIILFIAILYISPSFSKSSVYWHWQDKFSISEKEKLKQWISTTITGVEKLIGHYPFAIHIYFHRQDKASEPVPWAHTQRSRRQGVHFYVNPTYSLKAFLSDWTAPHELSHLSFPFLDSKNAWFSEGFASYMQYQVMKVMGVLTEQEVIQRYKKRVIQASRKYPYSKQPFAIAAKKLKRHRQYPTMYWGGAVYFLQVDTYLKLQSKKSFITILKKYLECCYIREDSIDHLVQQLDTIAQTGIFSKQLTNYRRKQGFPDYKNVF